MVQPTPITDAPTQKPTRLARGTSRQLILDAAKELFAKQDYRSTTTREIAERAGVYEHLLFRNFSSKAALYKEAVVTPFIDLVERFDEYWHALSPDQVDEEAIARRFLGSLYDLLLANRGLISTLIAAEGLSDEELTETGLAEIERAVEMLGVMGAGGINRPDLRGKHPDLAARSTVAMVMGLAAFGRPLFGSRHPSRKALVDEMVQMTLHGFLHRP